jgi:hypothetical protein
MAPGLEHAGLLPYRFLLAVSRHCRERWIHILDRAASIGHHDAIGCLVDGSDKTGKRVVRNRQTLPRICAAAGTLGHFLESSAILLNRFTDIYHSVQSG